MGVIPFDGELIHGDFGLLDGWSLVAGIQVDGHSLALLPGNVVQAVPYHVYQAELALGVGKD